MFGGSAFASEEIVSKTIVPICSNHDTGAERLLQNETSGNRSYSYKVGPCSCQLLYDPIDNPMALSQL